MREVVLHGRWGCQRRTAPRRRPDSLPLTHGRSTCNSRWRSRYRGRTATTWSGSLRQIEHRIPAITIEATDLPGDALALSSIPLLDLGGTYGDPEAGYPIQYDELRTEHDDGAVEIVVYNRAILLFMTETEAVKRIHQVCCRLDDIAGSRRPA